MFEEVVARRSDRLERFARLELEVEREAATVARASPSTVELTESKERERTVWEREVTVLSPDPAN